MPKFGDKLSKGKIKTNNAGYKMKRATIFEQWKKEIMKATN